MAIKCQLISRAAYAYLEQRESESARVQGGAGWSRLPFHLATRLEMCLKVFFLKETNFVCANTVRVARDACDGDTGVGDGSAVGVAVGVGSASGGPSERTRFTRRSSANTAAYIQENSVFQQC